MRHAINRLMRWRVYEQVFVVFALTPAAKDERCE
ncbi:MAG: HIG1 domain-containing protein [Planctomycetaceae bacterium]|nr:HIG1 domain-containing protein [Planctomycetaceae bacterium]